LLDNTASFVKVAEILGKFTASASYEIPRGADVCLRVDVPAPWLAAGSTIEVELPRNLTCARCSGGGCSACNNAGAITLRGKLELPEVVQVALPMQRTSSGGQLATPADDATGEPQSQPEPDSQPPSARPIVIRIPECGGLPDATNGAIVRGWLLLEVGVSDVPSSNVRLLDADEDPLSSAKLLRAEVRPSGKAQATLVTVSCSIRPSRHGDDGGSPPSSRVARVGSTLPPIVEQSREADEQGGALEVSAKAATAPGPTKDKASWVYVGIVIVAAIGLMALLFL
jgi:hypothetical protein